MAKEAFAGTGISVLTTGSGRLFSTLDHYLVDSQLSSFGTAFLTVFGVIFIVFRSWRFGALTIVPNVLPVLAVLGVMGYLDISMNIATVMVAASRSASSTTTRSISSTAIGVRSPTGRRPTRRSSWRPSTKGGRR